MSNGLWQDMLYALKAAPPPFVWVHKTDDIKQPSEKLTYLHSEIQ